MRVSVTVGSKASAKGIAIPRGVDIPCISEHVELMPRVSTIVEPVRVMSTTNAIECLRASLWHYVCCTLTSGSIVQLLTIAVKLLFNCSRKYLRLLFQMRGVKNVVL